MHRHLFAAGLLATALGLFSLAAPAAVQPHLVVITVDDMSADSVGAYGASVADTTPNIDQLAAAGMRFERAHVQVANCMPSRNVMWSGLYPHSNGVEGFEENRQPTYPTLSEVLQQAGYFTAIRNKLKDSTPYNPFTWDRILDDMPDGDQADKKDPASYGRSLSEGMAAARAAGKPLYVLLNVSDPHVPFFGRDRLGKKVDDKFIPSRIYQPGEITVPGFLVDDPVVREGLAEYYSTVRRADDAVGAILQALEKTGAADNTVVLLTSDHGMPFPFAKTQLYHHSTHTPLIIHWPGITKAASSDRMHLVSAVDFMPTLLEGMGATIPEGVQGRSFLPLLKGEPQRDRQLIFKEYNENSAGQRAPMRAVQSDRYLYVFNAWSDGNRKMFSATLNTSVYRRMVELAETDKVLAARLQLLRHRVVEELYDIERDPNCLVNLIDDPTLKPELEKLSAALEQWMQVTADHALPAFQGRHTPEALATYMAEQEIAARKLAEWKRVIRQSMNRKATQQEAAEQAPATAGPQQNPASQ